MSISILQNINITDSDIDEIESLLGGVTFDEPRRQIIKNLDSVDIQAFPGSGKTTVLIAKLAILAKKWPFTNQGICVLSHTNVAREEIQEKLGKNEIGSNLLSYPHFIGTLHSFFDTYIGIPWLRSNGYPITMIDTEITLKKRWKNLRYKTRSFLEKSQKTEFACESVRFPITINIGCSEKAPSYNDVKDCIGKSFLEGYFTFNEMLYIAKYALTQCSVMPKAIQTRFPILFIDEAQDTSDMQWNLITSAFDNQLLSVRQAFGDANQAIFQSYGGQEKNKYVFPSDHNMTIPNSHRFGSSIANLVDPLAVSQHGLVGNFEVYAKNDKQHTIFLFDKDKIDSVLQAYAKHLLQCFTDEELKENAKRGCYAVGMVHNNAAISKTDPNYPIGIRDYWNLYDPDSVKMNPKPYCLIEYFRLGRKGLSASGNLIDFVECITSSFRGIINANSTNHLSLTGRTFNAILSFLPPESRQQFRQELFALIHMPFNTEIEWNAVVIKTKEILRRFFNITVVNPSIFAWTPNNIILGQETPANENDLPKNVYNYVDNETRRKVQIHLASIHSVKGRTHLATMVVETFWNNPNIKSIIPWLCNKPPKKTGARNEMRLKCHYVALTRARGLICIALPKESVSADQVKLLGERGWNVIVL